ncbi:MAG: fluoride efflux transporter CrcB [Anaerolineales bacterium]
MTKWFAIGSGGFIGAILRYLVSGWVQNWSRSIDFPYGTLAVNLIGCFIIGLLSYWGEQQNLFSPNVRLFVFIGLLGAFTTFSTFGNETLNLLRARDELLALLNVGAHILLGLLAVWLGRVLAAFLWR